MNKHMTDLCLQYEEEAGASGLFVVKLNLSGEKHGTERWATLLRVIEVGNPALRENPFLANGKLYTAENIYDLQTGNLMKIQQEELTSGTSGMVCDATMAIHHYANGVPLRRYWDSRAMDPKPGRTYVYDFQGKQMTLPSGGSILGLADDGRYLLFFRRRRYRRVLDYEIKDEITIFDGSTGTMDCISVHGLYKHHIFYANNEWLLCLTSSWLIKYYVPSMRSLPGCQHVTVTMNVRNIGVEAVCVDVGKREEYDSTQGKLGWINITDMKWTEYPFEKSWGILDSQGLMFGEDQAKLNHKISSNGYELAIITSWMYNSDDPIERRFTMRIFDLVSGSLSRKHVLPYESDSLYLSDEWEIEVSSDLRILRTHPALIRQIQLKPAML